MIFDLESSAKVVSTHFFHNVHHGRTEYTALCANFLSECDYGAGRVAFPMTDFDLGPGSIKLGKSATV